MKSIANEGYDAEKRLFFDRRRFHYSGYIPERRSGTERRANSGCYAAEQQEGHLQPETFLT